MQRMPVPPGTAVFLLSVLLACGGERIEGGDTAESRPARIGTALSPEACSGTVADLMALLEGLSLPEHLMTFDSRKTGDEFDANLFFTVLDRISMEPGYVLDYVVYFDEMTGHPILYARPETEPPYETYADFVQARPGLHQSERDDSPYRHILTDGTPEGFFQLVLLGIHGEQFYLWWHAEGNDHRTVCQMEDARAVLEGGLPCVDDEEAAVRELMEEVGAFDLSPRVHMEEERVQVEVVTFTLWGGFIRSTYVLNREFPHLFLDGSSEVLVPFDCPMVY